MGLDAFVRCNCYAEGKCKPAPVSKSDIYVDEEGYLCSKTLDEAREKYDHRQFRARFGELDDAFEAWTDHPCEHDYSEYCSDWVSNIGGCMMFREFCEEIGEDKIPILYHILPDGNGGKFPVEKARAALAELDIFEQEISKVTKYFLLNKNTGSTIWSTTGNPGTIWSYGFEARLGLNKYGVFVIDNRDQTIFHSKHFTQKPTGNRYGTDVEMILEDISSGKTCVVQSSLESNTEDEAEFIVEERPCEYETHVPTALRNLLKASLETNNPIQWC